VQAVAAMLGPLFKVTPRIASAQQTVNRNSAPSKLRITDMRACRVAAFTSQPPDAWDRINVQGTRRMLAAAQQAGARRFIHFGT
jgi:nucleoside-diphosphate-sugar epimerase